MTDIPYITELLPFLIGYACGAITVWALRGMK